MRSGFITACSGSCEGLPLRGRSLSGKSYEHRRDWIRDRLEALAGLFGVEIAAFAVMSNHVHVILRNRPDVVALWSDQEVARRWLTLFPGRVGIKPDPTSPWLTRPGRRPNRPARSCLALPPCHRAGTLDPLEQAVAVLSADPALMATIRGRLSSLSWFMRALAEPIARRANREDHCTGRFFEGRFKSQRLLDEAALLACSVYVDLNPIRARLADRPETSELTSAHERIMALLQDIRTKPETARGCRQSRGGGTGGRPERALRWRRVRRCWPKNLPAALTAPAAAVNAGPAAAEVPFPATAGSVRSSWMSVPSR